MYPSAVVDGDDLLILCRSSRATDDQHDADLCTVRRIADERGCDFTDMPTPIQETASKMQSWLP